MKRMFNCVWCKATNCQFHFLSISKSMNLKGKGIITFLKMGHSRSLFLSFCLFNFNVEFVDEILPMLGFKPWISGIRSDRSINWATTSARKHLNLEITQVIWTTSGKETYRDHGDNNDDGDGCCGCGGRWRSFSSSLSVWNPPEQSFVPSFKNDIDLGSPAKVNFLYS